MRSGSGLRQKRATGLHLERGRWHSNADTRPHPKGQTAAARVVHSNDGDQRGGDLSSVELGAVVVGHDAGV